MGTLEIAIVSIVVLFSLYAHFSMKLMLRTRDKLDRLDRIVATHLENDPNYRKDP